MVLSAYQSVLFGICLPAVANSTEMDFVIIFLSNQKSDRIHLDYGMLLLQPLVGVNVVQCWKYSWSLSQRTTYIIFIQTDPP